MQYYVIVQTPDKTFTKLQQFFLEKLHEHVAETASISSLHEYNNFVRDVIDVAKQHYRIQTLTSIYNQEIKLIENNKPLTEGVTWGEVVLKKVDVEKDFIQKLLIIKQYGVLGFEIHEKKQERLEVIEGVCLIFQVDHAKNNHEIHLYLAKKGDIFSFAPRDEHGVIALTETVIEETSTNHLDDLVYIFKASQIM